MLKNKKIYWDYFILCSRVLLGYTLLNYGWTKLNGTMFGISEIEEAKPLKDLSLLRVSWYLFSFEPFNSFIGISQIIAGLLILYNRTLILGILISIPIFANILVIDISYVKMTGFYWRLSYYLLLDLLILWHYKERIVLAFKSLTESISTKFKYPLWAYLLIPIMAIFIEILPSIPLLIYRFIFHYTEMIQGFSRLFEQITSD